MRKMETNKFTGKFLHEALVTSKNLYPCDIFPQEILNTVLKHTTRFKGINDISSTSLISQKLLENLFWLFFCVKFQPKIFNDVAVQFTVQIIG